MAETVAWLSTKDVADREGVAEGTVRYWLWQGVGPRSYKIGRHRRFKLADVVDWEEARASEPRAAGPPRRTA